MAAVWHYFLQRAAGAPQATVVQSLARAGVSTHPLNDNVASGPGVLFFDQADQEVCNLIRQFSHNGLDRVLAVAVRGMALSGGGAWRLLQSGAADVFSWDHSEQPAVEIAARLERWHSVDRNVDAPLVRDNLVGRSPVWIRQLRNVIEVASFTDSAILVTGESGTGKELVARLIHTLDPRRDKHDLVVLDCTTIVPELSGSEFFGHERGAFTGAVTERDGAFALADGGTLFLDEVGDLPLGLQAELLRVVQEHTYKRVGSNTWENTSFRLVCATNRDLLQEEFQGRFRRDLYYRIAGWTCKLPPLRERTEDILPLAHHFLKQLRPKEEQVEMDPSVREYLQKRDYPGNVRDLKQVVSRVSYRHVGPGPITVGDIPEDERPVSEPGSEHWRDASFEGAIRRAVTLGVSLKEISQATADTAIQVAIGEENGNLQRAARRLGVTDRALQMRRAAQRQRINGGAIRAAS